MKKYAVIDVYADIPLTYFKTKKEAFEYRNEYIKDFKKHFRNNFKVVKLTYKELKK